MVQKRKNSTNPTFVAWSCNRLVPQNKFLIPSPYNIDFRCLYRYNTWAKLIDGVKTQVPNLVQAASASSDHLEQKSEYTFLGIIIDDEISWKPHINYISSKISKSIALL